MMKSRFHFLLLALLAAFLVFSCASDDAAGDAVSAEEQTVPVVASEQVIEDEIEETEPVSEPVVIEDAVDETPEENIDDISTEEAEIATVCTEEETFTDEYYENEFIPVIEEPLYILDVTTYYDDFSVSETDFEVVEPVLPEVMEFELVTEGSTDKEIVEDIIEIVENKDNVEIVVNEEKVDNKDIISFVEETVELETPETVVDLSELEDIPALTPSRSVTIHKNDIIEVPYNGNWWVYLGDVESSNTLVFSGRDYVSEKTVFTLRAVKEGRALLHFFKQDIIGGVLVDDYLEVLVEESQESSSKITLEEFVISQLESAVTAPEEQPVAYDDVPEDVLVYEPLAIEITEEAAIVSEAGVIEEQDVVSVEVSVETDEELFKRAQALEDTDIEGALALYKKLLAEYPASPYWNKANNRIIYINRFYFFKR